MSIQTKHDKKEHGRPQGSDTAAHLENEKAEDAPQRSVRHVRMNALSRCRSIRPWQMIGEMKGWSSGLTLLCMLGILLIIGVISSKTTLVSAAEPAPSAAAPTPPPGIPLQSLPDYPAAGIETGVWNEGKAALWDLGIIDQYKIFGPKQRAEGYKPEQPINFSHIVHVQQNKMECQYCHWNVNKGSYAAIPSVESCMGCHKLVKGRDEASQKEIAKLEDYYTKGEPIPWVKVHVMPNHYKFNHKRHVKAGVSCHDCHGQIPEMPVVERASSMKMGWCIDCHREQGSSIDCTTCHY